MSKVFFELHSGSVKEASCNNARLNSTTEEALPDNSEKLETLTFRESEIESFGEHPRR